MNRPRAIINMENGQRLVVELYPDQAPNTVNSFIDLARKGAYDGFAIQRIVPGYVVDVSYRAMNKEWCKYLIKAETRENGYPNGLKVVPGVVAMGGYLPHGIAGGEFFFALGGLERLDGKYPGFGVVVGGWEHVLEWEKCETRLVKLDESKIEVHEPVVPIVIRNIEFELGDYKPQPPVKEESDWRPPVWGK